jgi:hypothetical protein
LATTHATELLAHVLANSFALVLIDFAVLVLIDTIKERLLLFGWQTVKNALHSAHRATCATLAAVATARQLLKLLGRKQRLQAFLIALANGAAVVHDFARRTFGFAAWPTTAKTATHA